MHPKQPKRERERAKKIMKVSTHNMAASLLARVHSRGQLTLHSSDADLSKTPTSSNAGAIRKRPGRARRSSDSLQDGASSSLKSIKTSIFKQPSSAYLLGAYPKDSPPIEDKGDPRGLKWAEKYGYSASPSEYD